RLDVRLARSARAVPGSRGGPARSRAAAHLEDPQRTEQVRLATAAGEILPAAAFRSPEAGLLRPRGGVAAGPITRAFSRGALAGSHSRCRTPRRARGQRGCRRV